MRGAGKGAVRNDNKCKKGKCETAYKLLTFVGGSVILKRTCDFNTIVY